MQEAGKRALRRREGEGDRKGEVGTGQGSERGSG